MKQKVCVILSQLYKKEVGKRNVFFEIFVISETYDAYTFVLDSLFKMCPLRRGGGDVDAVFPDEFMTKSILDYIDIKDTHVFLRSLSFKI